MNFSIPRWLHVFFMIVLAIIGVLTLAVAKGDLQIAGPIMSILAMVALVIHSVDPETAAKIVNSVKVALLLLLFCVASQACLAAVPVVPVTPSNQAQVAGCQSIADRHNGLLVGGFVLLAGATGLGAVAAVDTNPGDRTGYAISAAIVGAITAVDTAWTALTTTQFTNGQCSSLVGPLQAKPPEQAIWVTDRP